MAINQVIVKLGADISELTGALKTASSEISGFSKTAMGGLSENLQRVGGSITNAGLAMTAGITLPMVGIGAAAVKTAGDFEQVHVAFTTMLGSGDKAKKLMDELYAFSAKTPFEFPEIQRSAKSLLAFGVGASDMTRTLTMLGDIASGVGVPLNEIAQIYGKAKVQGRLFAEDINQLTGRGIPVIQELAKQFSVSDTEVKQLVTDGKIGFAELERAFQSLTASGSQFGGMMDAQSQTLLGRWSTFKDHLTLTLAQLGEALLPIAKRIMEGITPLLEWVAGIAQKFAELPAPVQNAILIFAGVLAAIGPVVTGIGGLVSTIGTLIGVFGKAVMAIRAFGAIGTILSGPVGWIIGGIAALVTAGFLLVKNWDSVKYYGLQAWSFLKEGILRAVKVILNTWGALAYLIPGLREKMIQANEAIDKQIAREEEKRADRATARAIELEEKKAKEQLKAAEDGAKELSGVTPDIPGIAADLSMFAPDQKDNSRLSATDELQQTLGQLDRKNTLLGEDTITERISAYKRAIDRLLSEGGTDQQIQTLGKALQQLESNYERQQELAKDTAKANKDAAKQSADAWKQAVDEQESIATKQAGSFLLYNEQFAAGVKAAFANTRQALDAVLSPATPRTATRNLETAAAASGPAGTTIVLEGDAAKLMDWTVKTADGRAQLQVGNMAKAVLAGV